MPVIKVYHNLNFLDYRGQHTGIVPPIRPVTTVEVPEETPGEQALEIAYRQTQHISRPWWDNDDVLLHVRSTSVGDMLADEQGNLFVVESVGFQTYQPELFGPPPVSRRLPAAGCSLGAGRYPSNHDRRRSGTECHWTQVKT